MEADLWTRFGPAPEAVMLDEIRTFISARQSNGRRIVPVEVVRERGGDGMRLFVAFGEPGMV